MIYQPRNVQPSGSSIDGNINNTFTMEVQTNSYISAYQLLIVDFNNNNIYTGTKTTLTNNLYNGDILSIPVNASSVKLSNGTNYKWRVRLYQPNSDMLITYGLVQSDSTATSVHLQPNINIKVGMTLTINSQSKTITSYDISTGLAVVSSAFSSAPSVGAQYQVYSDFIETIPDYIVYARENPTVSINNVPTSLTLKYHTFQGVYTQSDNVPIVYHQFDLYIKNDNGTNTLVNSSGKVYSANLSYTYDGFRTGNTYLIKLTVENDMGVIVDTDLYTFSVSYDIVEYLQQPLATFNDKNNAVQVSWVAPVENEATSFRSDAARGTVQSNDNTLTSVYLEPGQSVGDGDVVQITNSDYSLVLDGKSTQATRSGKNLFTKQGNATPTTDTAFWEVITNTTPESDGWCKVSADNTSGTSSIFANQMTKRNTIDKLEVNTMYSILVEVRNLTMSGSSSTPPYLQLCETAKNSVWQSAQNYDLTIFKETNKAVFQMLTKTNFDSSTMDFRNFVSVPKGYKVEFEYRLMVVKGSYTLDTIGEYEPYGVSPSPDFPSPIESITEISATVTGKNLINPNLPVNSKTQNGITITNNGDGTYTATGTSTSSLAISLTQPNTIKLNKNTSYTNSIEILEGNFLGAIVVAVLDSEDKITYNYINVSSSSLSNTKIPTEDLTIKAYEYYINKANITVNFKFRVQLEKGTQATTYEQYKSNSLAINLQGNELCSLPNGTKDEVNITNGEALLNKKIKKVVFDGSDDEGWTLYPNKTHTFSLNMGQTIDKHDIAYCSHFTEINSDKFGVATGIYSRYTNSIIISYLDCDTVDEFKTWLSTHNVEVLYELAEPETINLGKVGTLRPIAGVNNMSIDTSLNTTFSLVYPNKIITGDTWGHTTFNPAGVKQTGVISYYDAAAGLGTFSSKQPLTYVPMKGDAYEVISNIYNTSGFLYLYDTPYGTVNSLYTHGYTVAWSASDGLCILPDDFNITLQFSPDSGFFYDENGAYKERVTLVDTEVDGDGNSGRFQIIIDKNKIIFTQQPDISLESSFYTDKTQTFVLTDTGVAQINSDYIWDDTATWNDGYIWTEGGTSIERVCNHWWRVQITNTSIRVEEIFPT